MVVTSHTHTVDSRMRFVGLLSMFRTKQKRRGRSRGIMSVSISFKIKTAAVHGLLHVELKLGRAFGKFVVK